MKDKMKKICIILLEIAFVVIAVLFVNRLFMPKYVSENQDGRITQEFYDEKTPVDVVFVGPSTVYNAVSPVWLWERYGFTSFVRGNASQTMWQSYYMVEDAIHTNKPKVVVADVTFIRHSDDFVEEPSNRKALDGMRLSRTKINAIKDSKAEVEKLSDYLFPLFRFHSRWNALSTEDLVWCFKDDPVTYNGHLMQFETSPTAFGFTGYGERDEYELGQKGVAYMRKLIELCQANDITIILMKTPSGTPNWALQYDAQIIEIANEYHVGYVNFDMLADEIGLDYKAHSPDEGRHLNTVGAELFTNYLGDVLKTSCSTLTDHRMDAGYADVWNQKVSRYEYDKAIGMTVYATEIEKIRKE